MLNALLYEDRKLVDGFDKQMSIYPVEDWPCFAYYRERMLQRYMESEHTAAAAKLVEPVRKQIEARGPLSSLELEEDTRMDWWLAGSVRAVRIALDILLYGGRDDRPPPRGNATIFRAHQTCAPVRVNESLRTARFAGRLPGVACIPSRRRAWPGRHEGYC